MRRKSNLIIKSLHQTVRHLVAEPHFSGVVFWLDFSLVNITYYVLKNNKKVNLPKYLKEALSLFRREPGPGHLRGVDELRGDGHLGVLAQPDVEPLLAHQGDVQVVHGGHLETLDKDITLTDWIAKY